MKNIFSALSKILPGGRMPKSTPQTAELAQNTQTHEHPSKGLTPQKLHGILEAAERGDLKAQSELFADIEEKDGHIFSEMSKRKRAVIGLDWRVMPPPDSTDAERRLAEEVRGWLERLTDFEDMMFDLLDAVGHGFACVEIEWQQMGGLWLPKNFIHRPQGWFKVDGADNVRLAKQDNPDGEELWAFGWLVHKHRSRSGLLVRGGLMRTLVWPYLFKNYSVRDLAEFLEIYGLPTRLGKYAVGADETDKTTLLRAVKEIGHNAAGIIPETMNIELLNAANGSSEPFMAMIDWADSCRRPPHHRLRHQRRNQPAETACPFGYRSQPDGKTLGNRRIRPNRHTGASHHLGRPSESRPYRQRMVSRHPQPALRAGRRLCCRDGERRRPRPPVEHAGIKQHRRVRKQRQNHAHRAGKRPV